MDVLHKMDLVLKSPTEEVITREDLRSLLETNNHPSHYIGFEISGMLHLGTLLICGYKINDLAEAGFDTTVYLADWHSYINNKMGGLWQNIHRAAEYYREAFRFFCPKTNIVLGSELYHNNDEYWKDVIKLSKSITLARNTRCLTIMGRSEGEHLDFAQYLYPPMQAVDIKYLGPDLPHGGMDQRKVHVLARDVYPSLKWKKPVPLHHHLLMGLAKIEMPESDNKLDRVIASKMSKSKPWSAIFIHDSLQVIATKLRKAYCPPRQVEMNPIMELAKYIIFHDKEEFTVERRAKSSLTFGTYDELESKYINGSIHPLDLKKSVAISISEILKPIREHFDIPSNAKLLNVFKETPE